VPLTVRKLAVAAKRDTAPDFLFGTHRTVSSGTGRKLREVRKPSQHRTLNSDASGVTLDASGVHRTKTQRALQGELTPDANSDTYDVTLDTSGVAPDSNSETTPRERLHQTLCTGL